MIKTAIIYGLADMCIDLITKPIISELDVMPSTLIGQRFDYVMAVMADDEIPPFVSPKHTHITASWGFGNIRLADVRVRSYENGVYRFNIYDSIRYYLNFSCPDLYQEYRKLYQEIGIYRTSYDINNSIVIKVDGNGSWFELTKSNIVLPSVLTD